MKKIKLGSFCLLLCIVFVLLHSSCKKNDVFGPKGNITFKGKLMASCSGPVLTGHKLRVAFLENGMFTHDVSNNIGQSTTDNDGNFTITCQNHGAGDYYIVEDIGPNNTINYVNGYHLETIGENDVFDLGAVYATLNYGGVFKLNIQGNYSPNDTLYVTGINNGQYFPMAIYPIPTAYTYSVIQEISNTGIPPYPQTSRYSMYWGIGERDYDSAYNFAVVHGNNVPPYHYIPLWIKLCGATDTTSLNIP